MSPRSELVQGVLHSLLNVTTSRDMESQNNVMTSSDQEFPCSSLTEKSSHTNYLLLNLQSQLVLRFLEIPGETKDP